MNVVEREVGGGRDHVAWKLAWKFMALINMNSIKQHQQQRNKEKEILIESQTKSCWNDPVSCRRSSQVCKWASWKSVLKTTRKSRRGGLAYMQMRAGMMGSKPLEFLRQELIVCGGRGGAPPATSSASFFPSPLLTSSSSFAFIIIFPFSCAFESRPAARHFVARQNVKLKRSPLGGAGVLISITKGFITARQCRSNPRP